MSTQEFSSFWDTLKVFLPNARSKQKVAKYLNRRLIEIKQNTNEYLETGASINRGAIFVPINQLDPENSDGKRARRIEQLSCCLLNHSKQNEASSENTDKMLGSWKRQTSDTLLFASKLFFPFPPLRTQSPSTVTVTRLEVSNGDRRSGGRDYRSLLMEKGSSALLETQDKLCNASSDTTPLPPSLIVL